MKAFITSDTPVTQEVLNTIAHLPTRSLAVIVEDGFFKKLTDTDFMRIAVLLALKGYGEGGCPIGGVIIDNETRKIVGKGHNTLVQENHPYNHGETSAARDAGRLDFGKTTMFTTLTPCEICATLIYMRQFRRVVVGDVTNASGTRADDAGKRRSGRYSRGPRRHCTLCQIPERKTGSGSGRLEGVAAVRKGDAK